MVVHVTFYLSVDSIYFRGVEAEVIQSVFAVRVSTGQQ